MKLTFENVFENREYFQKLCKEARACEEQYKRLLRVKTKRGFMNVVCDNFMWINDKIEEFSPKFDNAENFCEGYTAVELDGKYGFIRSDGTYLIEPQFDLGYSFCENGYARVYKDERRGTINTEGEVKWDT